MKIFNTKFNEESFDKYDIEYVQELCLSNIEANTAKPSQVEKAINVSLGYDGKTADHKLFLQAIFDAFAEDNNESFIFVHVLKILIRETGGSIIALDNLEKLKLHERYDELVFLFENGYCVDFCGEHLLGVLGMPEIINDLREISAHIINLEKILMKLCAAEIFIDEVSKTDTSFKGKYCFDLEALRTSIIKEKSKEKFLKSIEYLEA